MPASVRLVSLVFLVGACTATGDVPDTGTPPTAPAITATPPAPVFHLPYHEPTYTSDQVDRRVEPLRGPVPVYPANLKAAGVEGVVRLRFVVTATGRVDSTTLGVVRTTEPGFVAPAIGAIRRWTFRPAEIRGKPVAQEVEQNVRFSLGKRR